MTIIIAVVGAGGGERAEVESLGIFYHRDDHADRVPHGPVHALFAAGPRDGGVAAGFRAGDGRGGRRALHWRVATLLAPYFTYSAMALAWMIVVYGFAASVIPVWLLLAPRGALSTFVKLGAILALAVGITGGSAGDADAAADEVHRRRRGPFLPGKSFRSASSPSLAARSQAFTR